LALVQPVNEDTSALKADILPALVVLSYCGVQQELCIARVAVVDMLLRGRVTASQAAEVR
jgi:hypothetical protein